MLSSYLLTFLAAGLFSLVRATQFQVTVGGPGILQYNPESVVSMKSLLLRTVTCADIVARTPVLETPSFSPSDRRTTPYHSHPSTTLANSRTVVSIQDCKCPALPLRGRGHAHALASVPVADNNTDGPFPAAQYTVTDENPVWIFCRQANHCQQGMVFAVNPGDQFSTFKANAFGNNTANSSASATSATASSTGTDTTSASATGSASVTASVSASVSANATATAVSTSTSTTDSTIATSTDAAVVNVTPTVVVSETAAASATSSAAGSKSTYAEHIVLVGEDGKLAFEPSNITANVGDIVTFLFTHANHSATQSSFSKPCSSLAESGQSGFDSGL